MASSSSNPVSYGSNSSNPRIDSDLSSVEPSPPQQPRNIFGISSCTSALTQQHCAVPQILQNVEFLEPWQVRLPFATACIRYVEILFKESPTMRMVAEKHADFVRKTAHTIERRVDWELYQYPGIDWIHRAKTMFDEVTLGACFHPLILCAFGLPDMPYQTFHSFTYELRQELRVIFGHWIDRRTRYLYLLPSMLAWIHFPRRQLGAKEFRQAIKFPILESALQQDCEPTCEDLTAIGCGYVHFSENPDNVQVSNTLSQSLRDYFGYFSTGDIYAIYANMGLACLNLIYYGFGFEGPCANDESLDDRLKRFPLLAYAAENWSYNVPQTTQYMEQAASFLHSDKIVECLVQFQGKLQIRHKPEQVTNLDLSQWYQWNTTRLSYAVSIGIPPLVEVYLRYGCVPNENDHLQPILVSAALRGDLEIVQLLLAHGANVHATDFAGRTALYVAVLQGRCAIIDCLVGGGADLRCQTKDGMTPLMAAICHGDLPLAKHLLHLDAREGHGVYLEACDGQTALSYALMKPEFFDFAIDMIVREAPKNLWPSSKYADITLYEAITEIKDPFAQRQLTACIERLDASIRSRGSPVEIEAWEKSFVRKILDRITANSDLSAVLNSIRQKRQSRGMISSLTNTFRRKYMLDGRVGKGAFSSAWKAIDMMTGKIVAVKFMLTPSDTSTRENAVRETKFMTGMQHPNILKCLETTTIHGDPVIVTEFAAGGDLWHYLLHKFRDGIPDEGVAKNMFRQIIAGLAHMHKEGVVHRDLKSVNILVFENDHIKIADFGNSKKIPDRDNGYVRNIPCTPTHIAPEAINDEFRGHEKILAKPCDIYSAGVCLYEILAGKEPFDTLPGEKGHGGLHKRIRQGDLKFEDQDIWGQRTDLVMHLMARMMNLDPKKRPTAEEVLLHPWLTPSSTRQCMLDMHGLRTPHDQKPESFTSQRPEWITPRPRTRRGDHSYSEGLDEQSLFTPYLREAQYGESSLREDLERFRGQVMDFSVPSSEWQS